jgi:hypothetical protein|nr:MAG TPA: hypothetical protein [Bacteriophage sp.]
MERLTNSDKEIPTLVNNAEYWLEVYFKLKDIEDAEEHGLLLRLPISEDTPVYSIEYCCGKNKSNRSGMCFRGFCENCSDKAYYIRESVAKHCSICEINKSVFFTHEEAESKLAEMEGAE